jgi:hypothetical protein
MTLLKELEELKMFTRVLEEESNRLQQMNVKLEGEVNEARDMLKMYKPEDEEKTENNELV